MAKPTNLQPSQPGKAVAASAPSIPLISTTTQLYQGPIPPPEILERFDRLVPGTAARLINLAIEESEHRRDMESQAMKGNTSAQHLQIELTQRQHRAVFRSDLVSQLLGAVVTAICIVGAVYLAANGHEGIAALLCAVPTGALIQAFFVKRKS